MSRFATPLLLAGVLLAAPAASAQDADPDFTTNWEFSAAGGTLPSFIGAADYGARGLAYGMVDDGSGSMVERVFVATATGGTSIQVLDASTGAVTGTLSLTGIEAAGRRINDVGVSDDGVIIACNEVNNVFVVAAGSTQNFECFRWNSLTAMPTRILNYTPQDGNNDNRGDWLGSLISVVGSASDNTLTVWTAAARDSDNVYYFMTDDNGATFTANVTKSRDRAASSVEGVAPMDTGAASFYHNLAGRQPVLYTAAGDSVSVIADGSISPFTTSIMIFEGEDGDDDDTEGDAMFMAAFNWEGSGVGQRAELADISGGPGEAFFYAATPSLGSNANVQANGDVDGRMNDDGTITLFVLATNNGIGSYTTTDALLTDAEDGAPGATALRLGAEPNPFAAQAQIRYEIGEAGPVRLAVYDALGRQVATLVDGVRPAGADVATFDARALAAGVYVVRLESAGASVSRLVTLAR